MSTRHSDMSYCNQKTIYWAWEAKQAMRPSKNRVRALLRKACSVNIFANACDGMSDRMMRCCLSVLIVVQG